MSESEGPLNEHSLDEGEPKGSPNYLGRVLLLAIFAVVVYLIVRNISFFANVLLVLLGFGAVVIVHEFGHFIVAKLSGIKVEAFSIFMPPTLLGIQRTEAGIRVRVLPSLFGGKDTEPDDSRLSFTIGRTGRPGETEYRIGLIPFGGFVKMLGQEDTGPVKESDDPRSYANKPVGTRMAVISAGVFFNVISAVILFVVVFLIGINLAAPVIGAVVAGSPAARAGLKPGDEIIEIAGKRGNLDFSDIQLAAALSDDDEEVALKVNRDGEILEFAVVAEREDTPVGEQKAFGVLSAHTLTIAQLPENDVKRLFERTGLKPGDRVTAVNGKEVHNGWELEDALGDALGPHVMLSAERTNVASKAITLIEAKIALEWYVAGNYDVADDSELSHICGIVPRLRISNVSPKTAKEGVLRSLLRRLGVREKTVEKEPGLEKGDIVLAVGDVENPTYKELRDITEQYEGKTLSIRVLRAEVGGVEKVVTVGVVPARPAGRKRALIGISLPTLDAEHPVVAKPIVFEDASNVPAIPRGAVITAVDGEGVSDFYDIVREIRKSSGPTVRVDYSWRDDTAGTVDVGVSGMGHLITVRVGFAEDIPFEPLERLYRASGPVDAVVMGYKKTLTFVGQTYVTLKRLIGGVVKVKDLTGPVGIMAISYRIVTQRPFIYYLYFVGLISAIIAVMNFLPLAPLDGGWIVFLLVEKFKGSALSERTQGAIVYTGWALIGALLLYVTFNDFVRYIVR